MVPPLSPGPGPAIRETTRAEALVESLAGAPFVILSQETDLRLAKCGLMLERFRRSQGAYPERLEELSAVGFQVPLDPATEQPFVYQRLSGGYLIYGLGANQRDDHGAPPCSIKNRPRYSFLPPTDLTLTDDLVWSVGQ
jgi:hypothetical protein